MAQGGRPASYTRDELIQIATHFQNTFGKFPARDDFKGDKRAYYEQVLGQKLPHARSFEHQFGSWQAFRDLLNAGTSKYTANEASERVSMDYAVNQLGMVEVRSETGTVDGFIGEQRVEVKGAMLTRASSTPLRDGQARTGYRWRWQTHYRELSKLVDRLLLVGIVRTGEIAVVIDIQGEDQLRAFADGRRSVDFSLNCLLGDRESQLWPYVTQLNPNITDATIEEYL